MSTTRLNFSSSTSYTITLASLANNAARCGVFVDNSTNLYLDVMFTLAVTLQAGTPSNNQAINLWFYGSEDGTNYTDNATGTDSALTMRVPTNLRGPFSILTPTAGGLQYRGVVGSVSSVFGGVLPRRWGLVVENRTGLAFSATEGTHIKSWTGIKLETV